MRFTSFSSHALFDSTHRAICRDEGAVVVLIKLSISAVKLVNTHYTQLHTARVVRWRANHRKKGAVEGYLAHKKQPPPLGLP